MTPKKSKSSAPAPPSGTPTRATLFKQVKIADDGTVYTNLGKDYGIVQLSKADFARFRKDYSKGWGGRALNQDEMATQWGFPDAHAVALFVRIHGLRHTSDPFTDEELEVKGVAAAVDEAVLERRHGYKNAFRTEERRMLEKDALKWHKLEDAITQTVGALAMLPAPKAVKALKLDRPAKPYFAVIGSTDIHYGKVAYDAEGRVIYSPEITETQVNDALAELLWKITRFGKPECVYLMVGSDNIHIDTPGRTTTKSTPLAISTATSATYPGLLAGYIRMTLSTIAQVKALGCEVVLALVPGNHDFATSLMIFELLKREYRLDPQIRFLARPDEPIFFENAGEVTLAFNHGQEVKKKDIHREFLNEAPRQGVAVKRTKVLATGHLHHLSDIDCDGVDWIQFPSTGPADEYHKLGRWAHARACMAAALYSYSGDKESTVFGKAG